MNKIFNNIKEVPNWEKVVIAALVVIPIPFTIGAYLGVRTIVKQMKNNAENKKDES